jgi:replicative DNA helicase
VYSHIDSFNAVPGDHVFDLLEDLKLKPEQANALLTLVEHCAEAYDGVNVEYVFSSLEKFFRKSILSEAIQQCAGLLDNGNIDQIENVLQVALKKRLQSFNAGQRLPELIKNLATIEESNQNYVKLGIKALDDRGIIPKRKELFLFAAPPKGGKSWGMIHTTVKAMLAGKKVVYISLEMSEEVLGQRLAQAIFNCTKHPSVAKDILQVSNANTVNWARGGIVAKGCIEDDAIQATMLKRANNNAYYNNVMVKAFPTGQLSIGELKAYLDNLETTEHFAPDVIVIDYADLLRFGQKNGDDFRIALGQVYADLRGIAVERNAMVVSASQINRMGAMAKKIDMTHVSESFAKAAIVDNMVIIQGTPEQRNAGIAVLHVGAARNDESGFDIYITQNIAAGQWVLNSSDKISEQFREVVESHVLAGV